MPQTSCLSCSQTFLLLKIETFLENFPKVSIYVKSVMNRALIDRFIALFPCFWEVFAALIALSPCCPCFLFASISLKAAYPKLVLVTKSFLGLIFFHNDDFLLQGFFRKINNCFFAASNSDQSNLLEGDSMEKSWFLLLRWKS